MPDLALFPPHIRSLDGFEVRRLLPARAQRMVGPFIFFDHLAALPPAGEVTIHCTTEARLMLLGGAPVGERHIWWNFVSSSRERIEQAKQRWREQAFPPVPGETEFTPLPDR